MKIESEKVFNAICSICRTLKNDNGCEGIENTPCEFIELFTEEIGLKE